VDFHQTDTSRWFAEEVQPHDALLKAYLRRSFPAVRDLDDVVQEAYLRLWRARLSHRIRFSKAFLFQVARRIVIDLLRRERVSPIIAVTDLAALNVRDERLGTVDRASLNDELIRLTRALDALPPRLREVMILRKLEGLPQKEIAARLGLSEFTVQVHVVRGLQRLQELFRRMEISPLAP
jgi:RNA polymerase sigma-70 factor (ECF subfamily)